MSLALVAASVQDAAAQRPFELVTPSEKGGNGGNFAAGGGFATADGGRLLYATFAALPGSTSNVLGNPYVATRTWPSWISAHVGIPVNPIGALQGSFLRVYGVSQDRTKVVIATTEPLTDDTWEFGSGLPELPLFLHDTTDGSYQLLTPPPVALIDGECERQAAADVVPYGTQYAWGDSDFSHILFTTTAALTCDAIGVTGSKVYTWRDGQLDLQSIVADTPSAASAGGFSATIPNAGNLLKDNALSADGAVAWFTSPATTAGSLYRRAGGETVRVNQSENTTTTIGPGSAWYHAATPDGSKVLFISNQSLVDADSGNSIGDLYMYTHSANPTVDDNLTLISANTAGGGGADAQGVLGMSESGEQIYFVTGNQIVDGAPTRPSGRYIYVWDDGSVEFLGVTTDAESTIAAGLRPWNSTNGNGSTRNFRWGRSVASTGRALLMSSQTRLDTPALDDVGPRQVYLYDHDAPGAAFECISCPPGGPTPASSAQLRREPLYQGVWANERQNLSIDGDRAFFESVDALLPEDVNGQTDVYMWENGELSLISTGRSDEESYFVDASANGDSAFFLTWEQLSGWDTDGLGDVYAARVGGGLPEPQPGVPPCVADQCQGEVLSPPGVLSPGSGSVRARESGSRSSRLALRGPGVAERRRAVRSGTVRVRVRSDRAGRVSLVARARIGGRARVVGRTARRVRADRAMTVALRLTPLARRQLRAGRRLVVQIAATAPRQRTARVRVVLRGGAR